MENTTHTGILFPANTNSDWDSVDALFMPLEMGKRIIDNVDKFAPIIEANGLFCMEVLDASPTFILTEKLKFDPSTQLKPVKTSLTNEELASIPENKLKTYATKYFNGGNVTVQCYGEHTNEEFWAEISIITLKQLLEVKLSNQDICNTLRAIATQTPESEEVYFPNNNSIGGYQNVKELISYIADMLEE